MKFFFISILFGYLVAVHAVHLEIIEKRRSPITFMIKNGEEEYSYYHYSILSKIGIAVFPVQRNHLFAYAINCNLIVLDSTEKKIILREVLPNSISEIRWIDDVTLDIKVTIGYRPRHQKAQKFHENYRISTVNFNDLPGCSWISDYRMAHVDISTPLSRWGLSSNPNDKRKKKLEKIKKNLQKLKDFDVTNPWINFYDGIFELRQGFPEKSHEKWQEVMKFSGARWYHLFLMGMILHQNGQNEQGKQFHEEAMSRLFARGFQPRMQLLLIETMNHKGSLAKFILDYRKEGKWEEASQLLEEVYEFAPRCELFCGGMLGFANELENANRPELAKIWRERAEKSEEFYFFGGGIGMSHTFFAVSLSYGKYAVIYALPMFIIIMLLKSPYLSYFFNFRYRILDRSVLWGILAGMTIVIITTHIVAVGLLGVSLTMNIPWGAMQRIDHPCAYEWIDQVPESAAKNFYRGLALQIQKKYDEARQEYQKALEFAETYNNLGVIDYAEKKDPQENFEKASSINPNLPELRWNLHKEVRSSWISVHKKYNPDKLIIAAPSQEIHRSLYPQINLINFYQPFTKISRSESVFIALWGGIAICLWVIFVMFLPQPPIKSQKLPKTWGLAFICPGSSKYWGFLGFFIAAVWFTCVYMLIINQQTVNNLSFTDLIVAPSISQSYGVSDILPDLLTRQIIIGCAHSLLIALPLINTVMLLIERKTLRCNLDAKRPDGSERA